MRLTDSQLRILEGLAPGNNHYVSASEMSDFGPLTEAGYVQAWLAMGGTPMWNITDLGRAALAQSVEK